MIGLTFFKILTIRNNYKSFKLDIGSLSTNGFANNLKIKN